MLHVGVFSREDCAHVTIVLPAHSEWRRAIFAERLQDLGVTPRLAQNMGSDHEPVSWLRL